jgi:hypothetical protein
MSNLWYRIFYVFQQHLLDLRDLFKFSDLSTFTQNNPVGWVASALLFAQASIRRCH